MKPQSILDNYQYQQEKLELFWSTNLEFPKYHHWKNHYPQYFWFFNSQRSRERWTSVEQWEESRAAWLLWKLPINDYSRGFAEDVNVVKSYGQLLTTMRPNAQVLERKDHNGKIGITIFEEFANWGPCISRIFTDFEAAWRI